MTTGKQHKVPWEILKKVNKIDHPELLKAGEKIKVNRSTSQTEICSPAVELLPKVFESFREDIHDLFSVDIRCSQQEFLTENVKGLKKRFKKLAAVSTIKSEGALEGTFRLVFDRAGLFTLGGVIATLPEEEVLKYLKRGSIHDARDITDAIAEAGNILVGSWEEVFRKEMYNHNRFLQTDTFIGHPWDKPKEKIGLTKNEEFIFVPYEIGIGSYPTFNCGVIFPKTIFSEVSKSDAGQPTPTEERTQDQETAVETPAEKDTKAVTEEAVETGKKTASAEQQQEQEPEDPGNEKEKAVEAAPAESAESAASEVSETVPRTAHSSTALSEENSLTPLAICAKDIMQDVIWCNPDDSVQQALTKMQQHNAGYMIVGADSIAEGIISKSDITGAVSPYLKPIFAKWRRPLDDATLQIRVKWIMSKPVRTVAAETSLAAMMENMCRSGGRCLPVVDQQDKIQGLVTVFDVFKALLKSLPLGEDISTVDKTPQAPSLAQPS